MGYTYKIPERRADWKEQQTLYFMRQGDIWSSLYSLNKKLKDKNIDYCVVGGLALNLHGYERLTTDIDLLMTVEGLSRFKTELVGLGYRPAFSGAEKTFYDGNKTRIEILVTGEFPGDGKPKPISFPFPRDVATEIESFSVIDLPNLIDLKLASGISSPARLKDLADVIEIIKILDLSLTFVDALSPYVKEKYQELWTIVQADRFDELPPNETEDRIRQNNWEK